MALSLGASAAWVGTRFVNSTEAACSENMKKEVIKCKSEGTVRTLIFTGRPLRVIKNPYIMDFNENRGDEIKKLCSKGVLPYENDVKSGKLNPKDAMEVRPILIG